MQILEFWGLNWENKSLFFIQENVASIQLSIYQFHNKFLEQWTNMKTKLHTFAQTQILRKSVKNWLKYSVLMTKI